MLTVVSKMSREGVRNDWSRRFSGYQPALTLFNWQTTRFITKALHIYIKHLSEEYELLISRLICWSTFSKKYAKNVKLISASSRKRSSSNPTEKWPFQALAKNARYVFFAELFTWMSDIVNASTYVSTIFFCCLGFETNLLPACFSDHNELVNVRRDDFFAPCLCCTDRTWICSSLCKHADVLKDHFFAPCMRHTTRIWMFFQDRSKHMLNKMLFSPHASSSLPHI